MTMKYYCFLMLSLCFTSYLKAQNVYIPDANFKTYLVENSAINTSGDEEIQINEAEAFDGVIWCLQKNITDLTGIEAFTSLTELNCSGNQLKNLDVSKNVALTQLYCENNQLTNINVSGATLLSVLRCSINELEEIDVSNNTELTWLDCYFNKLTSLELSKNTALSSLRCEENQLTSLDLKTNTELDRLWCYANELKTLDVSEQKKLTWLYCYDNLLSNLNLKNDNNINMIMWAYGNPNLYCVQVDDADANYVNCDKDKSIGWCVDSVVNYSENCSDFLYIPDAKFKSYLLNQTDINTNEDSEIQISEAEAYEGEINCSNEYIYDLTGIEAFVNLTMLNCWGNKLTSIDVSKNTKLMDLSCHFNLLTTIDVSQNTELLDLTCSNNRLESLDVSKNIKLTRLSCYSNNLTSIDVSNNSVLTHFSCYSNDFTSLNLSGANALTHIYVSGNELTSVNVLSNEMLEYLDCRNNKLTNIDLSNNSVFTNLYASGNDLTSLNIKNGNNSRMQVMWADSNPNLNCIQVDYENAYRSTCNKGSSTGWCKDDVASYVENCEIFSPNVNIPDVNFKTYLLADTSINLNQDDEIQVGEANSYEGLIDCSSKNIFDLTGIEAFTNLTEVVCYDNNLISLDFSNNIMLNYIDCTDNDLVNLNIKNGNNTNIDVMWAGSNPSLNCIQVDDENTSPPICNQSQTLGWCIDKEVIYSEDCTVFVPIVNIPDSNFKTYLLGEETINVNGDSEIQETEALIYNGTIDCSSKNIYDLTGVEFFKNLKELSCWGNELTSLDLSNNKSLINLYVFNNNLKSLDISNSVSLAQLSCSNNSLTILDVSNNTALIELNCFYNNLKSIDVSENLALTKLVCYNNDLTSIDISQNTLLTTLSCYDNKISDLNVLGATRLAQLYCMDNELENIDLSSNKFLRVLNCEGNQLTGLNLKNGNNTFIYTMFADDNVDLTCIQVDDKNNIPYPCNREGNYSGWCKNEETSYSLECDNTADVSDVFTSGVSIIPNPVNDWLTIKLLDNDEVRSVVVLNILGEELLNLKEKSIDFRDLSKGVYFLRIESITNKVALKKVIKN